MGLSVDFASSSEEGDRKPVTVPPPAVYQGVGAALRNSYSAPPIATEEFRRLLSKLK
ncbi:hypothetical protein HL653_01910 [Sphingomonas sp. AP4-R1]|uniref:hypothetical protein n=1 Tax=Sphingomonas sp. AP4-R1 TaxID=2735134 RepID=UPI0014936AA0|nr:hypothetical protein [Sphingomonas sp. AP4-R1]QJU56703.1 hypothetical protein HL653_01910 [Sphingomonas sp. AP4-R1]